MAGKRIGYIRVSTPEQNPDRQLVDIQLDKKFVDYASARTLDRPQLKAMMDYCREEDVIYVHSMDRLARNASDLRKVVDEMISKGIEVRFVKENITIDGSENSMSKLILTLMAAFAEFEWEYNRERQREGIEIARKAGKYKGTQQKKIPKYRLYEVQSQTDKMKSKSQIARELGVSRTTYYKYMRELRKEEAEKKELAEKILSQKLQ